MHSIFVLLSVVFCVILAGSTTTPPTEVPTLAPTRAPTISQPPTFAPTNAPSFEPSLTPSLFPTMEPSAVPTPVPSPDPTFVPSSVPTTPTPTAIPSAEPTRQPTSQPSGRPTRQPSSRPSSQPTVQPSSQPSRHPSSQPSKQPSSQPSSRPSSSPSCQPTASPTTQPSCQPTGFPTSQPSSTPSQPSSQPTGSPTRQPSSQPSSSPSRQPTAQPTGYPTTQPTSRPSSQPTRQPTGQPTSRPSCKPSSQPTVQPSGYPSNQPSGLPTGQPSSQPTVRPSVQPSAQPSARPTTQPSRQPSARPTGQPSAQPSSRPTRQPSRQPTSRPSTRPSTQPSSQPTNPTTQPSSQPSGQPIGVPSTQPSGQPTSSPSAIPECPAGSFYSLYGGRGNSSSVCRLCPAGMFNGKEKSLKCDYCNPGYFSGEGSTACTICPHNQYSTTNGSTSCRPCGKNNVNGKLGSFTKDDCVNPSINFISAGFSLIFCGFVIFIYLLYGRFQKVAFQRQWRLTTKCLTMFAAMIKTADLVTIACHEMNDFIHRNENESLFQALTRTVFKPMLFYFLVIVAIPMVIIGVIMQSILKSLFSTMVLWRAYKGVKNSAFLASIVSFLAMIDRIVFGKFPFFYYLSYPFIHFVSIIQSININLPAVNVTCTGAQAPLLLLADLIVLYIVILVIEADYQVLWATMILPAMGKIQTIIFSRYYFGKNRISTTFFVLTSYLVTCLPDPSKLIQYALGWVSVLVFFEDHGHARSNTNCDGAVSGLPLDTIFAVLTTFCAYALLFPAIYLVSEVLVPSTKAEDIKKAEDELEYEDNSEEAIDPLAAKNNVYEFQLDQKADSFTQVQLLRVISIFSSVDWLLYRFLFLYGNSILSRQQRFLLEPYEVRTYGSDEKHRFYSVQSSVKENIDMIQSDEDIFTMRDKLISIRSRVLSAKRIPALPWFDALESEDTAETIMERTKEKKVWEKVESDLPSFTDMCKDVRKELDETLLIGGWLLSWLFPVQIMTKKGKKHWKRVGRSYIAMMLASFGIWPDWVVETFDLKPKPKSDENEEEQSNKPAGRQKSFRNFSFRGWLKALVATFDLNSPEANDNKNPETISKVERYTQISNSIYGEDEDDDGNDVFVRIENDEKLGFAQFMSATVTTRIALIQLIPVFTLASTVLTDLSCFPLFVSKEMDAKLLPPRIDYDAVKDAIRYLKAENSESGLPLPDDCTFYFLLQKAFSAINPVRLRGRISTENDNAEDGNKIWLALFLSVYLFLNRSRMVNFGLTLFMDSISIAITFKPEILKYTVPIMTTILLIQGLINGIYVSILLQRLFFRKKTKTAKNRPENDSGGNSAAGNSPKESQVPELAVVFPLSSARSSEEWFPNTADDLEENGAAGESKQEERNLFASLPDPNNPSHIVSGLFWTSPEIELQSFSMTPPVASPVQDTQQRFNRHSKDSRYHAVDSFLI
jgi:hypothetical protein